MQLMLFLQWKGGQSVPSGIFIGYLHHNNSMYSVEVTFFLEILSKDQQKRKKTTSHTLEISRIKGLLRTKHKDLANVL